LNEKNLNKVLLLCSEFPPGPGGIGNHAWNLARNLNYKVPVDVITKSDYIEKEESDRFDKLEDINIIRFNRYSLFIKTFLHRIFVVIKQIRKRKYTHYILSGFFSLTFSHIIKLIDDKVTIVGVLHGSELIQTNFIMKFVLRNSLKKLDVIISVSNYTNQLIPIGIRNDQKNIIIPNGVNKDMLELKSSMNSPILCGEPCLLTVGSITDRKGQINLINALPIIKDKYPNVHYHCVGLPIDKKRLLKQADSLGVSKHITIHGFIRNNELVNVFKQADILIMLSQSNSLSIAEGFGIAILEANLFGVPALGSKKTGIEDAIIQNETGILVNPYSSKEVLDGIDLLLDKYAQFAKSAYEWSLQHTWPNISNRYLEAIIDD